MTYSLGKGDLKQSILDKMKRQKNIVKKKEQGKNPQDKINKGELVKLCEK